VASAAGRFPRPSHCHAALAHIAIPLIARICGFAARYALIEVICAPMQEGFVTPVGPRQVWNTLPAAQGGVTPACSVNGGCEGPGTVM
jgi:hypothetical protein